jgi:hypothetical protein
VYEAGTKIHIPTEEIMYQPKNPMTLRQMAARLNQIIAENDRRGRSERNDLPVVVEIPRKSEKGNLLKSHFAQVGFVNSCQNGLHDQLKFYGDAPEWNGNGRAEFCGTITAYGYSR